MHFLTNEKSGSPGGEPPRRFLRRLVVSASNATCYAATVWPRDWVRAMRAVAAA